MVDRFLASAVSIESDAGGQEMRGAVNGADAGSVGSSAAEVGEMVRESLPHMMQGGDSAGSAIGQAAIHAANQAAETANTTTLGTASFNWGSYVQAIGILFLLLALLWLLVWLVRRFGKFSFLPRPGSLPRGALSMEAQMPLGPRKGLMVVRFLNKRLLLGITDQQITLLSEEQVSLDSQKTDFQKVMETARRQDADGGVAGMPGDTGA